jgi:hypothetical protein
MSNVVKKEESMRVAVWFDRPRDHLCFADRLDERVKDGEAVPEDCIIRIPLLDAEDFVEAVMNAARVETNFWKIMDAVQVILDRRAKHSINLSELLRLEWGKRAGGVIGRIQGEVSVRADEWIKHQKLREKVLGMLSEHEKKTAPRNGQIVIPDFPVHELQAFVEENDLDGPGSLPSPESETPGAAPEEGRLDQPPAGK